MPSTEREGSREPEGHYQHSESGRGGVPMWDSSDPDRAPPPLPLNPGVNSPTTKANTSAGIAAAAKQIVERARESRPLSSYTSNDSPRASPDKTLVKGAHHRRMLSLQSGSVKDLRSHLDGNRSPERSPERPLSRGDLSVWSRHNSREDVSSPLERSSTPTPAARDPLKDTPTLRPTARQPPRPLLGENTPPSATMLALQTMQVPEQPFSDVTNGNGPTTPSSGRIGTNYDFSSQLLNLTSIATSLQREMMQLSRRSKDNATDLISLKEATHQRDEDIRRSLRELTSSVSTSNLLGPPPAIGSMSRSASSFGATFLESKPFYSPPSASKAWSVPRAASVHSFIEDVRAGSPSPYSVEGAASVAMLEKIIREMVTKDGQERLLSTLSELLEKSRKESNENSKKVEELAEFIKDKSESQALVALSKDGGPPKLELNFDSPGRLTKVSREGAREFDDKPPPSGEIMNLLTRIKESVQHSGGTTSEVKGLVRDLRGEVLGMGRELGKKLDQVSETQLNSTLDRGIQAGQGQQHTEDVQRIVEEGMNELKQHLSSVLSQRAEQDDSASKQLAIARSGPDGDEMFAVVKHALAEHSGSELARNMPSSADSGVGLDHDGVLEAVKEGLKDFEPNIELQQFGLERDEILAVLKEGLEDYQNSKPQPAPAASIDKGEIYEVMQEALKDFQPTIPAEAMSQMKHEILDGVRQVLQSHLRDPASATSSTLHSEATRSAVIAAVHEGLASNGPAAPRELDISRADLFDAVKSSLDGSAIPFGSFGGEVLAKMQLLVDNMHDEFRQYSAANGRDTEQVLDAMKDGLESLRAEVEQYVDRAQDVTGKDEIVETVKGGLEQLRADVQGYCARGPENDGGRADMLEYVKAEFEHLHETMANHAVSREIGDEGGAANTQQTATIIHAISQGMENLKTQVGESNNRELEIEMPTEELIDAMKAEFEQLQTALLEANADNKAALLEAVRDNLGALHAKRHDGTELSQTEDLINEMHAEFNTLKETLPSLIGVDGDRNYIVAAVRQCIEDLRTQLAGDHSESSAEALTAIKDELAQFRESTARSFQHGHLSGDDAEALSHHAASLESIHAKLDEVKDRSLGSVYSSSSVPEDLVEALRGEFEKLRTSLASSVVVHGGPNEDMLETVRLGLDDLRTHIDKKLDNPDASTSNHGELLNAINEGLETLRGDIVKTLDKPLDMTVNYEILDTLKEGLAGLRSDVDALRSADGRPITPKSGEIVLADGAAMGESRGLPFAGEAAEASATSHGGRRGDLQSMEVLLAQLQIKIEAMNNTLEDLPSTHIPRAAEGTAMRSDVPTLEAMIREVQAGVAALASRETTRTPAPEGAATKDDIDAIETLLRNTKAQLEEMVLPDPATTVTKDHLDAVEAVVRITNETIDGLAEKLESTTAGKGDVAVVEVLVQDVKAVLEELKERMPAPLSEDGKPDVMTKTDLDVLGMMCTEIKAKVNDLVLPDPDDLPSKSDIEQLQGLIADFRESHDKLRDSYETDIAVTAKAFDDRKVEYEVTVQEIKALKESLTDIKDELMAKLGEGESGINTLGETMKGIEDKSGNHEPIIAEVKEVVEVLSREFERAHGSLEAIKVDHQQTSESALEKQAEHKDALVTEIGERLDTLFDGLMSKYDDAQHAAEEKAKALEEKAVAQEELLNSTKAMAADLRLSIDTLGTALTVFTATFPDHLEKMAEESKTVFNRVDDTYNKLDETQEGLMYEHNSTREEVAKVISAIAGVHGELADHNPRFMTTLNEVKALIGQHYTHSQQASDAAAEHRKDVNTLQEQLKAGFEESKTRHLNQTEELKSALPALLPSTATGREVSAVEVQNYDNTALHEKLDKLVGHAESASYPSVQLERLDQIHEKVMATAAEVSAFVAAQARQITDEHESKEKEAEEVALLLERRMVQKDEIEADITAMNEEKETLRTAVEALKAEREALTAHKSGLAAAVSSLETALQIRREELHEMDRKAEAIERRMLEGVMSQSRMLLLAKGAKSPPKKKPQGRDLRVASNTSALSAQTAGPTVPGLKASHALALGARPAAQRKGPWPNTAERRIMSLNQISPNLSSGVQSFSTATPTLFSSQTSGGGLKRSHSVKSPMMRKPSWAGNRNVGLAGENKENSVLSEEDEGESEVLPQHHSAESRDGDDLEDFGSETATERRTSFASCTETTLTHDEGSHTDGITPSTDDGRRTSYGTSERSYDTGSYMTGSEIDRRTSLADSATGVLGIESGGGEAVHDGTPDAGAGADFEDEGPQPLRLEVPPATEEHKVGNAMHFAHASDSGLGADLPTATLSGMEGEFFGRGAE